ncbi:hypothetical protein SLE2022_067110 [Rubroshorea leprosula]
MPCLQLPKEYSQRIHSLTSDINFFFISTQMYKSLRLGLLRQSELYRRRRSPIAGKEIPFVDDVVFWFESLGL